MKLVHKIGGGFIGLVIIISFLGIFTWIAINSINTGIKEVSETNLPVLLDTETAAFKVQQIQSLQTRYVFGGDKSIAREITANANDIITSADKIIEVVREVLKINNNAYHDRATSLNLLIDQYSQVATDLTEFKGGFQELASEVKREEYKQAEMLDISEKLAVMINMFYKVKDNDQTRILKVIDIINSLKKEIDEFLTTGDSIKNSYGQDVKKSLAGLEKSMQEILTKTTSIIDLLDKDGMTKAHTLKYDITIYFNSIVGLTSGSGKEFKDLKDILEANKDLVKATDELKTIIDSLAETPKKQLNDNTYVVTQLKEQSVLVTEVRLANLNYIISKDTKYKNITGIKLKRSSEKLDQLNSILTNKDNKDTVAQIKSTMLDYQKVLEEWQNIANSINTVLEPNSTVQLNKAAEDFKNIVKLVEKSTSNEINKMVEQGNSQATFGAIISAVSTIIGLILACIITLGVRSGILQVLNIQNKLVHEGDLQIQIAEKSLNKKDEIGQLFRVAESVLDDYKRVNKIAQRLASGQWQTDVVIKSEKDEMNQNLSLMIERVNMALRQVASTVQRVAHGAEQVRGASKSLSDGATSQAASLEEITSSMSELGSQTNLNAEHAEEASILSKKANTIATDGKERMNELATAMEEISKSSADTQKVVKTIDDIAFQTNLLALNAAVEAARAGSHGKGFAVVAEEVRNLAARSAKAAGETAELIDSVIKEIKKGNSLATVTAGVLDSVAVGINKATELVGDIASASLEQAHGVAQINIGLEQIETVTMQNTANAEETASATEEMKGQASELQNLISRFDLKVFPLFELGCEDYYDGDTVSLTKDSRSRAVHQR